MVLMNYPWAHWQVFRLLQEDQAFVCPQLLLGQQHNRQHLYQPPLHLTFRIPDAKTTLPHPCHLGSTC